MVCGSEGCGEHVELDSESGTLNEIKQKISKEFETKFDELQGEIKDMQRNMRDVVMYRGELISSYPCNYKHKGIFKFFPLAHIL